MVDLFDAPAAEGMSEVEKACLLAGQYGSPNALIAILMDSDRPLSPSDRTHIALLVRGDYSPSRGRKPNELKPSYMVPKTAIQQAALMARRLRGGDRFKRGTRTEIIQRAADHFGLTFDQVDSEFRRGK